MKAKPLHQVIGDLNLGMNGLTVKLVKTEERKSESVRLLDRLLCGIKPCGITTPLRIAHVRNFAGACMFREPNEMIWYIASDPVDYRNNTVHYQTNREAARFA